MVHNRSFPKPQSLTGTCMPREGDVAASGSSVSVQRRENVCAEFKAHCVRSGLHPALGCGWLLCMVGYGLPQGGPDLEREKGIRWMPWHQEAMKDVARCEKPRGAASRR